MSVTNFSGISPEAHDRHDAHRSSSKPPQLWGTWGLGTLSLISCSLLWKASWLSPPTRQRASCFLWARLCASSLAVRSFSDCAAPQGAFCSFGMHLTSTLLAVSGSQVPHSVQAGPVWLLIEKKHSNDCYVQSSLPEFRLQQLIAGS